MLRGRERSLGQEHGKVRAHLGDYDLDDVIREYRLFRQVLLEALEADRPLAARERDLLLDAIEMSVTNAAREFTRSRMAEREDAAVALQKANREVDAKVRERTADLVRSEARFRHLVEGVADYAIFTLNPGGFITTWNTGAHRMKGYTAREAIGSHYSMLYPEDGKCRDEPMAHLRIASIEHAFVGKGYASARTGTFRRRCLHHAHARGGRADGLLQGRAGSDRANLLLQERDLSRTDVDKLKFEAQYKDQFVSTLTHDLRSPLAVAASAAALIARAPEQQEYVRTLAVRITDAVRRLDNMISDLLDANELRARASSTPMEGW